MCGWGSLYKRYAHTLACVSPLAVGGCVVGSGDGEDEIGGNGRAVEVFLTWHRGRHRLTFTFSQADRNSLYRSHVQPYYARQ